MNSMLVLCLSALLVGAVQGQGIRGRQAAHRVPHHLDVGLPDTVLGGNSPLLIHLKDQGLWDKENGAGGGHSKAALLPSILKSYMENQYPEEAPYFDTDDITGNAGMISPQMMIRSLVDEEKLPDLEDLEEMVNSEDLAKELYASEKSEDRVHFFFKLRDALKNMYVKEDEVEHKGSKGLRSQVVGDGGFRFNLEDLETELKEKLPDAQNIDLASNNVSEKEVLVSLVELLKEYVAEDTEKSGISAESESVEETQDATDIDSETAKIVEELRKSNVSVSEVDHDGGIFFNLGDEQVNAKTAAEP